MMAPARLGRPPKGRDKRTPLCVIKASPAEAKVLRKAAQKAQKPLAVYLRDQGLALAP